MEGGTSEFHDGKSGMRGLARYVAWVLTRTLQLRLIGFLWSFFGGTQNPTADSWRVLNQQYSFARVQASLASHVTLTVGT